MHTPFIHCAGSPWPTATNELKNENGVKVNLTFGVMHAARFFVFGGTSPRACWPGVGVRHVHVKKFGILLAVVHATSHASNQDHHLVPSQPIQRQKEAPTKSVCDINFLRTPPFRVLKFVETPGTGQPRVLLEHVSFSWRMPRVSKAAVSSPLPLPPLPAEVGMGAIVSKVQRKEPHTHTPQVFGKTTDE